MTTVSEATLKAPVLAGSEEKILENQVSEILDSCKATRSELIPMLQKVQEKLGYVPASLLARVHTVIGKQVATIVSIRPRGKEFA